MKEAKQGKRKKSKKGLVIVLAILVLLVGGGFIFYVNGISATDPGNKDEILVTVKSGSGAMIVLNQLEKEGLVHNKLCGKVYVKIASLKDIKANTYVLNKDMTLTEIFDAMNSGDPKYILQSKFTIVEGATIPQAAETIAKESGLLKKEILKKWSDQEYLKTLIKKYWFLTDDILNKDLKYPLEGYLYPSTYFLPDENPSIEQLTAVMLDQMDEELSPIKDDITSKLNMSVHQFLSFASVVERESLFEQDRAKIAGVFKNRLDKDMPLQSDITVLYALGETRVAVTNKDLQVDSKYNTYKNKGVPVGPVCAVPRRTMDDCLNYEPSDYLFFFATKEGKVLYSKTYAEHQKVVKENKWY